jgi:hypothetical protein
MMRIESVQQIEIVLLVFKVLIIYHSFSLNFLRICAIIVKFVIDC